MKPIETHYNGYRFRSRLEARWAVFFDAIGVEWEYEKEGYDLGDAGWYLPDFWLPRCNSIGDSTWVEVKSEPFTQYELQKCYALSTETDKPCLLLSGMPTTNTYTHIFPIADYVVQNDGVGNLVKHGAHCVYGHIYYIYETFLRTWSMTWQSMFQDEKITEGGFLVPSGYAIEDWSCERPLRNAIYAARSARFEHGETPKIINGMNAWMKELVTKQVK